MIRVLVGRDHRVKRVLGPAHLADLLWMHSTKGPAEATYPERGSDR